MIDARNKKTIEHNKMGKKKHIGQGRIFQK